MSTPPTTLVPCVINDAGDFVMMHNVTRVITYNGRTKVYLKSDNQAYSYVETSWSVAQVFQAFKGAIYHG